MADLLREHAWALFQGLGVEDSAPPCVLECKLQQKGFSA